MSVKTTMRLLAAVIVMSAALWFARLAGLDAADTQAPLPLPFIEHGADVNALRVETPLLVVSCVLRDGQWLIDHPVKSRAEGGRIEQLLAALESLVAHERISPEQRAARELALADYGLDNPAVRVTVVDPLGVRELRIGAAAPLRRRQYVMLGDSPHVYAVDREILEWLPVNVDGLRSRTLIAGTPARTVRVELHRAGQAFMRLVRHEDGWRIRQPIEAAAEASVVHAMIAELYGLQVSEFVWDPGGPTAAPTDADTASLRAEPAANIEAYGLAPDEAWARVSLWLEGELLGRELIIGREDPSGHRYVRTRDGESIFAVDVSGVSLLTAAANDFREDDVFTRRESEVGELTFQQRQSRLVLARTVGDAWAIREPVQWEADRETVQTVLRALLALKTAAFSDPADAPERAAALDAPTLTIRIGARSGLREEANAVGRSAAPDAAAKPDARTLAVVVPEGDDEAWVYARFEDETVIRAIARRAAWPLAQDAVDPLRYKDRTLLAVAPANVRSITLLRGDSAQTVVRGGPEAVWQAEGTTQTVQRAVVDDVLLLAAALRALRVEAHNPDNLAAYGLAPPATSLTLGLTGEEGIQKTLLIGYRSMTDGLYAMVKGQNVVFVIPTNIADLLTRSLLE